MRSSLEDGERLLCTLLARLEALVCRESQNGMAAETTDRSHIVYGSPGSGSVPVEAALALIGAPYEVIGEAVQRDVAHNRAVFKVNPLGQYPRSSCPAAR